MELAKPFIIWGRLEHLGLGRYLAIASAIREDRRADGAEVMHEVLASKEAAEMRLQEFVLQLGEVVRGKGGRIVDVETDGI